MAFGQLHAEGQRKFLEMAAYYRCPEEEIEDRFWLKLDKVLYARDATEAQEALKRATETLQMGLLAMWSKKKIKGPLSSESQGKEAKKADSLADMLEKKGDHVRAAAQRKKAEDLRAEALALAAVEEG